jgi:hypothetical protein
LHVIKAKSNNGSARNYLSGKFDHFVNLSKISYLNSRGNGHLLSPKDDIELMMDNFSLSGDISFVSLSDVPVEEYFNTSEKFTVNAVTTLPNSGTVSTPFKDTIAVATAKDFSGKIVYTEIHDLPGIACLADTIQDERCERNLTKTDALFIAVAWTCKPAFRLFKLCPEVVWVDVTSHLNNKGFHLLTISSRLSIGKQIVWMWVLIPNQQRFSFRWEFQQAIPTLVPQWLRDRVKFFMKGC